MTKKDFINAASIVRESEPAHQQAIAIAFAVLFSGDNPRFDVARFREACFPTATPKGEKPRRRKASDVPLI